MGLPKKNRLPRKFFFPVSTRGQRVLSESLQLRYLPNHLAWGRVGIVISKKIVPSAIKRNYLKRLIAEFIKEQTFLIWPFDSILTVSRPILDKLKKEIKSEIGKITENLSSQAKTL